MTEARMLKDRKFVIFDAAQIDVNSIVALAYQLQEKKGVDKDGKPVATLVQVAVIMLDNGSSVTLGDTSLEKFEIWWKQHVKADKVDLPAPPPAPPANANVPANTPAPAATPPAPKAVESPAPVAPVPPVPVTPAPTPTPPAAPPAPLTPDAK